jgi:phosphatidylglycerophosphatase C
MKLVLFDFDGTITTRNSLFEFVRFVVGGNRFIFGMMVLSPMLAFHKIGFINAQRAKERLLNYFIGGKNFTELEKIAVRFCAERLPHILRKAVMEDVKSFARESAQLCIVSASCDLWIKPFADSQAMKLVCTKLNYDTLGNFTGRFSTPNCNGPEKANRLKQEFNLSDYSEIIVYGNSSDDNEMFALGTTKKLIHG